MEVRPTRGLGCASREDANELELAFDLTESACRRPRSAADAKLLPQPEPRAVRQHFIVPSICSRDVACAEWSNVRRFEHLLQLLDVVNNAFHVHASQSSKRRRGAVNPKKNRTDGKVMGKPPGGCPTLPALLAGGWALSGYTAIQLAANCHCSRDKIRSASLMIRHPVDLFGD